MGEKGSEAEGERWLVVGSREGEREGRELTCDGGICLLLRHR